MKFTKNYMEILKGEHNKQLPVVHLKKLKKILKNCDQIKNHNKGHDHSIISNQKNNGALHHCSECEDTFFPSLLKDMSEVVHFFNNGAQNLVKKSHLANSASLFRKYVFFIKKNLQFGISQQANLSLNEVNHLIIYATLNAVAIRKILKKYDKVHCCRKGQKFRVESQAKDLDMLKSPWLLELMALHINLSKNKLDLIQPLLFETLFHMDAEKPYLLVTLFSFINLNFDLTCPICLETVFDPISLSCSHILCYMCACSIASVTIVDGLKNADPKSKCPICRQAGVNEGAVHLDQLGMLLSRRLPEYWEERLQRERKERLEQAKEHWELQCRAFMGYP